MMKRKRLVILPLTMAVSMAVSGCTIGTGKEPKVTRVTKVTTDYQVYEEKPVICLYPEETTDVQVQLNLHGDLTCTYPSYENGWQVTAQPDGTLTNHADGREYSYLYWEGVTDTVWDMSEGFVVKGEDTAEFLQQTLAEIGLTPREYNEFIVYWLPKMQDNPYNLITFQQEAYTDAAQLDITPQPDSLLRVFMAYQPLSEPVDVTEPEIAPFTREGFTVIEWGGTEVK